MITTKYTLIIQLDATFDWAPRIFKLETGTVYGKVSLLTPSGWVQRNMPPETSRIILIEECDSLEDLWERVYSEELENEIPAGLYHIYKTRLKTLEMLHF